ncbi:hypothetical protein C6569_03655 [Phreatobacter cathodiphilus]|uniref:DUF4164 domain-containing protein n=1 Tax=Phreatobacter cathodiphilus TaxID=1868589 RepID=A0A2S0N7V7_9HYPH|nr:DUF4164 domain-containing protein [Phreatobacter cathodiphilus]AVO44238.1 hypothetical protein C6569_03655 [Phreatobacter cathodiphilus]
MGPTTGPSRLETAASRLKTALAALETAVARKLENDRQHAVVHKQVEALQADRSRLAEDLDRSADRVAGLESVNREVARRLDLTMDAIRGVLARYES